MSSHLCGGTFPDFPHGRSPRPRGKSKEWRERQAPPPSALRVQVPAFLAGSDTGTQRTSPPAKRHDQLADAASVCSRELALGRS